MLSADLHTHTDVSDGAWCAEEVVRAASARSVRLLAITDHDEVAAIDAARPIAQRLGITLVSGIELSAQWRETSIHVVGLNINEKHPAIVSAVAAARSMRKTRALQMGELLATEGYTNAYAGALALASSEERMSRTHFARFLVNTGVCGSMGEVFSRFMKPGKPGYVATLWPELADTVATIRAAGGTAVIAHPARYDLQWLGGHAAMFNDFKAAGGGAIEVICPAHSPAEWSVFAAHCRKYGFAASIGSDFHSPRESRVAIGDLPRLPGSLTPVWDTWNTHYA